MNRLRSQHIVSRSRGAGCDLTLEFQQFAMQCIVLPGIQRCQVLNLRSQLVLLPRAEPNRGQSEHDTNRGLA